MAHFKNPVGVAWDKCVRMSFGDPHKGGSGSLRRNQIISEWGIQSVWLQVAQNCPKVAKTIATVVFV